MAWRVFEVRMKDAKRFEDAMLDDTLSRQSVTLREARHFGIDRDTFFVLVEGSDAGMLRAEALVLAFGRRSARAEEIRAALKAEDDAVAENLGRVLSGPES